jgi:hypothetical protein
MTGFSLTVTAQRVAAAGIRQLLLKPASFRSLGIAVAAAIHSTAPAEPPC